MIILDTNVVSELMRPVPSQRVVQWVSSQPLRALFTTANTQAEILLGVALLPTGRRRKALQTAVEEMFFADFEGRVLPFDGSSAPYFARIVAARREGGRPITHADAQIGAIAMCHGATVATRNVGDFESCGVALLNPWEE